ncbi:hypothetical protein ACFSE1_03645 [Rhizobium helianthi]|uniref:Transmembrane protein n=1 Tax=Rhizobium helianthi TaxID=1132695 RepID=A0ABW4LZI6_9HYPH
MSNFGELTPEEAKADHWHMLRFLAVNAALGFLFGLSVAVALVWLDVAGLGTRIFRSNNPWMVFFILSVPMAFTFSGAVTGSAVMLMPYKRKKDL